MRLLFVSALFVVASSASAAAESAPCLDSANTVEKGKCLDREVSERNRKIDSLTAIIRTKLSKNDTQSPMYQTAAAFDRAQAAWKGYRESECDGRRLVWGAGTGASAAYSSCLIELTDLRIQQLQSDQWPK